MLRFFLLILLVGLLALLQAFGFSVFGVKPNLALVGVIAASFFIVNSQRSVAKGLLLVVLAVLILKFSPGFGKELLFFSLISAGAIMAKNHLPWRYFLSNFILVALATLAFYLLLAPNLILSIVFIKELFLNLLSGSLIFAILSFFMVK